MKGKEETSILVDENHESIMIATLSLFQYYENYMHTIVESDMPIQLIF